LLILAHATDADPRVALERTDVLRQRLWAQYTQATVLAYHADAEANRALAIAVAVTLPVLAGVTLWLVRRARRNPVRGRTASILTLALIGLATAAYAALWAFEPADTPEEPPLLWWAILVTFFAGVAVAPFTAFEAFVRREGRLAGIAVGLSLVYPTLYLAGFVACAFTDACFH
jgi:hypothetical protein